jgi:hypothetical protein
VCLKGDGGGIGAPRTTCRQCLRASDPWPSVTPPPSTGEGCGGVGGGGGGRARTGSTASNAQIGCWGGICMGATGVPAPSTHTPCARAHTCVVGVRHGQPPFQLTSVREPRTLGGGSCYPRRAPHLPRSRACCQCVCVCVHTACARRRTLLTPAAAPVAAATGAVPASSTTSDSIGFSVCFGTGAPRTPRTPTHPPTTPTRFPTPHLIAAHTRAASATKTQTGALSGSHARCGRASCRRHPKGTAVW